MSSDDPSKDWDRYCQREEERNAWAEIEDLEIYLRSKDIDFTPVDADSKFVWFIHAKRENCVFKADSITGDQVCINYPTMKAPVVMIDGEELDLEATGESILSVTANYSIDYASLEREHFEKYYRVNLGQKAPTPNPVQEKEVWEVNQVKLTIPEEVLADAMTAIRLYLFQHNGIWPEDYWISLCDENWDLNMWIDRVVDQYVASIYKADGGSIKTDCWATVMTINLFKGQY